MKRNLSIILPLMLGLLLMFSQGCTPDDPEEEEEITIVQLIIGTETFSWDEATQADTIILNSDSTYSASAEFLNGNVSPAESITAEIRTENDEHIVCYEIMGGANVTITRTDSDGAFEVGLATEWVTGASSTGTLLLKLRHQPDVKDGTCTPGDSDVEVTFPVKVI